MAWSTIRKATEDDQRRINAAAERFIQAHANRLAGLTGEWRSAQEIAALRGAKAEQDIEYAITPVSDDAEWTALDRTYLRKLWTAATRRALRSRSADGIAYGYVGFNA